MVVMEMITAMSNIVVVAIMWAFIRQVAYLINFIQNRDAAHERLTLMGGFLKPLMSGRAHERNFFCRSWAEALMSGERKIVLIE